MVFMSCCCSSHHLFSLDSTCEYVVPWVIFNFDIYLLRSQSMPFFGDILFWYVLRVTLSHSREGAGLRNVPATTSTLRAFELEL